MLIALMDEPQLLIFDSLDQAISAIEAPEAEAAVRVIYDDRAIPYRVEWMRPNKVRTHLFGLLRSIDAGDYRLIPAGPADPDGLLSLLEQYPECHPPEAKPRVDELKSRLLSDRADRLKKSE